VSQKKRSGSDDDDPQHGQYHPRRDICPQSTGAGIHGSIQEHPGMMSIILKCSISAT
jgi:hypothetical protein